MPLLLPGRIFANPVCFRMAFIPCSSPHIRVSQHVSSHPFAVRTCASPASNHRHHHGVTPSLLQQGSGSSISTALQTHPSIVTAPSIVYGGFAHTFHLFLAFVFGGLFFSTALSIVTAFAALGRENIERGWDLTKTVLDRVWNIFTYGLNSARETLVEGKRWKWRDAYQVLKEQLTLTRKAAVEGIEAIKLEASLYSSAVGQPGLIALQYFVDNLTPKLLSNMAKESLENALSDMKNPNVRRMKLISYDFGGTGPKLVSARTYDLDNAIALDIDVNWESKLKATVKVTTTGKRLGLTIPVTMKNLRFEGVVRVVLTPLTDEPPGFGAALISFPKAPIIGLDVAVSAVELTKTPWLKAELLKEIQKAVADEFLWPRRIIVPSGLPPQTVRPVLSKVQLEELKNSDPLLKAEKRIDDNALIQKTKLKRDVANERDLGLDIFIGDEEDLKKKQLLEREEQNETKGSGLNEDDKAEGDSSVRRRFPWQRTRSVSRDATT